MSEIDKRCVDAAVVGLAVQWDGEGFSLCADPAKDEERRRRIAALGAAIARAKKGGGHG